jgi:hypothetical protein
MLKNVLGSIRMKNTFVLLLRHVLKNLFIKLVVMFIYNLIVLLRNVNRLNHIQKDHVQRDVNRRSYLNMDVTIWFNHRRLVKDVNGLRKI